jgi:hypothetical protein
MTVLALFVNTYLELRSIHSLPPYYAMQKEYKYKYRYNSLYKYSECLHLAILQWVLECRSVAWHYVAQKRHNLAQG